MRVFRNKHFAVSGKYFLINGVEIRQQDRHAVADFPFAAEYVPAVNKIFVTLKLIPDRSFADDARLAVFL